MSDASGTGTAFLTAEQVEKWKAEFQAFGEQIEAVKREIEALNAKMQQVTNDRAQREVMLRKAEPFVPGLAQWLTAAEPEDVALTEAIKRVLLMHRGRPLARDNIRALLHTHGGYPAQKLNSNPNYFYTALKRLSDRQQIMEAPPGHFRLR